MSKAEIAATGRHRPSCTQLRRSTRSRVRRLACACDDRALHVRTGVAGRGGAADRGRRTGGRRLLVSGAPAGTGDRPRRPLSRDRSAAAARVYLGYRRRVRETGSRRHRDHAARQRVRARARAPDGSAVGLVCGSRPSRLVDDAGGSLARAASLESVARYSSKTGSQPLASGQLTASAGARSRAAELGLTPPGARNRPRDLPPQARGGRG